MKHLFTKTLVVATVLTLSSIALADSKDLKLFNAAFEMGAEGQQFMARMHVSLTSVQCDYSILNHSYGCTAFDNSGGENQGKALAVDGKPARRMFNALEAMGAPRDNGMGHIYVGVESFTCKQAVKGVMDGSAAERTICDFQIEAQ